MLQYCQPTAVLPHFVALRMEEQRSLGSRGGVNSGGALGADGSVGGCHSGGALGMVASGLVLLLLLRLCQSSGN